jgi:hypothetical protein
MKHSYKRNAKRSLNEYNNSHVGRDSHTSCLQCEQLPVNSLVDRDKG